MALETLRYFWRAHGKSVQRVLTAAKLACTYTCAARRSPSAFSSHMALSRATWMPTCIAQLWCRRRNCTSAPNAPLSSGER